MFIALKNNSNNHLINWNFILHVFQVKKNKTRDEHWILFAYVFLRKNPPKIRRGKLRGVPRDVAAVTVGAIVDTI